MTLWFGLINEWSVSNVKRYLLLPFFWFRIVCMRLCVCVCVCVCVLRVDSTELNIHLQGTEKIIEKAFKNNQFCGLQIGFTFWNLTFYKGLFTISLNSVILRRVCFGNKINCLFCLANGAKLSKEGGEFWWISEICLNATCVNK